MARSWVALQTQVAAIASSRGVLPWGIFFFGICICSIFFCGLCLGQHAAGGTNAASTSQAMSIAPGQLGHRLVARFDFEERHGPEPNYSDMPKHWFAIGRRADTSQPNFMKFALHQRQVDRAGFPAYTDVRFDTDEQVSGEHSFMLRLNGGSAGAFLEIGSLPALAGSDYLLTTMVRTTPLRLARAQVVAYLCDDRGRTIEASRTASPLLDTEGKWMPVSIQVFGDHADAAWLCVELLLLQAEQQPSQRNRDVLPLEEIEAAAWFDDISIWQVPRVSVRSQNAVGVVRDPEQIEVHCQVRDLTGRALEAEVRLFDAHQNVVASTKRSLGQDRAPGWVWKPDIEQFGWYLMDLRVSESQAFARRSNEPKVEVARALGAVVYLPDERQVAHKDVFRFRVDATDSPVEQQELLPELLRTTRLRSAALSCWHSGTTLRTLEQEQSALDQVLYQISRLGGRTRMVMAPVPDELSSLVDLDDPDILSVFGRPAEKWMPYVKPVLMRHGQHVRQWQLGPSDHDKAFYRDELPSLLAYVGRTFRSLTPGPELTLPWRGFQSPRDDLTEPVVYLLSVSPAVRSPFIGQLIEPWRAQGKAISLNLQVPPATALSQSRRVQEGARRLLYGWEAGANELMITKPWTGLFSRETAIAPDPLLGVFSASMHRLAGRKVVGRLKLGPGMTCMILDGPETGALAFFNRFAPEDQRDVSMFIGEQPQNIDVWGNRKPVPIINGKHQFRVEDWPQFIEPIDVELARFRAAFRVEPKLIESRQTPHQLAVHMFNPWPRTITGRLLISDPEDWQIQPRRHFFSIGPGQSSTLPLKVMFPVSEVAGRKKLVAKVDFTAVDRYVVDVSSDFELGLPNVQFDASLVMEPNDQGGMDAVVTQFITNRGSRPLSMYAFAQLQGFPRQERIIAGLQPGQALVKRFRFPNAQQAMETHRIRAGLRETGGPAVLNQVLSADDMPEPVIGPGSEY